MLPKLKGSDYFMFQYIDKFWLLQEMGWKLVHMETNGEMRIIFKALDYNWPTFHKNVHKNKKYFVGDWNGDFWWRRKWSYSEDY